MATSTIEAIREYLLDGVTFLKRDKKFDAPTARNNDIIESFMELVDADHYVLAHATSPFTPVESIEKCIAAVCSGAYDSAFTVKRILAFLWKDSKAYNYVPEDVPRTQDLEPLYAETNGAFVLPRDIFIKYKLRTGIAPYLCEISALESVDIDYPEEFELANAIYMTIMKERFEHGER